MNKTLRAYMKGRKLQFINWITNVKGGKIIEVREDGVAVGINGKEINIYFTVQPLDNNGKALMQEFKKFADKGKDIIQQEDRTDYSFYIKTPEWKYKAMVCVIACGKRCEVCHSKVSLQAHHYNYLFIKRERPEDLFCLCKTCHVRYHDRIRNKDLPRDKNLHRDARLKHLIRVITE